jgi:hypothetical protein
MHCQLLDCLTAVGIFVAELFYCISFVTADKNILTIADKKLTKSLRNFENKQPNCSIMSIFVFQVPFIDCILSEIVSFDQLWTVLQ